MTLDYYIYKDGRPIAGFITRWIKDRWNGKTVHLKRDFILNPIQRPFRVKIFIPK